MSQHFADRLAEAVRRKGTALCVGLDPRWDQLPDELKLRHGSTSLEEVAAALEELCLRVLDIVAPLVPVVKPQSAFFEACGPAGLVVLQRVLRRGRQLGLLTILDSKRNDIASTAQAYADAAFGGVEIDGRRLPVWDADALTVNAYLGRDAIEPFLASARRDHRGLFVLVRTSNPGAGRFQDLPCEGKPLFHHVASAVGAWTRENLGRSGLGDVGAVVGATHPAELAQVRQLLPETWFLVPGYGAQGGRADDVMAAFRPDGLGAVINSSRGITACFKAGEPRWEAAIHSAVTTAVGALRVPARSSN
jgi:orotidine-5'-phosphate decarboxylase